MLIQMQKQLQKRKVRTRKEIKEASPETLHTLLKRLEDINAQLKTIREMEQMACNK